MQRSHVLWDAVLLRLIVSLQALPCSRHKEFIFHHSLETQINQDSGFLCAPLFLFCQMFLPLKVHCFLLINFIVFILTTTQGYITQSLDLLSLSSQLESDLLYCRALLYLFIQCRNLLYLSSVRQLSIRSIHVCCCL